jgi:phosphoserine phosphatase
MIFLKISPKISDKKLAFLTQNKAKICEILIITLVFEKNANFFAENCQKPQKIVIITSTPDEFVKKIAQNVAKYIFVKNNA